MAAQQGNPFYVSPMMGRENSDMAGSFMQGMQIKEKRDAATAREAAAERERQGQEEMMAATTPAMKLAVMRKYPELAGAIQAETKWTDEQTKKNHADTYKGISKVTDPQAAVPILQERIKFLRSMGADSTDTEQDLEALLAGDMTLEDVHAMAELEQMGHEDYRQKSDAIDKKNAPVTTLDKLLRAKERLQGMPEGEGKTARLANLEREIQQQLKIELNTVRQGELNNEKLEAELALLSSGALKPSDKQKLEADLRKEIRDQSKVYEQVDDSYRRVLAAADNADSAAGDMALIFAFMKMLDPGSTVREGEFASAQQAGGWDDRVESTRQQILSGKRLSDAQRADFVAQSKEQYQGATVKWDELRQNYTTLSEQYGVDPANVIFERARADGSEAPPSRPGNVPENYVVMEDTEGNRAWADPKDPNQFIEIE